MVELAIKERLDALEKEVTNLAEKVETVACNSYSVSEVKSKLSTLEKDMGELKSDVKVMNLQGVEIAKMATTMEFIKDKIIKIDDANEKKDKEVKDEMNTIKDSITLLKKQPGDVAITLVKWVGGIIGTAVLGWALAIIIGANEPPALPQATPCPTYQTSP